MEKRFAIYVAKVDKNGSKHWVDENCPKCGGKGYIPGLEYSDGARCWKCGATGHYPHKWVEHTKEYQAKLNAKREERLSKKNLQDRLSFLEKHGFGPEGKTYVVVGNTFDIKEELKAKGAKFNPMLGWHLPVKHEEYKSIELSVEDCFDENSVKALHWKSGLIDVVAAMMPKQESTSNFIGNIGEKIEVELTQVGKAFFESQFGTTYINMFEDSNGNKFVWKTGKVVAELGEKVKLAGTIKEHNEYKNEKQTVLTRCKVV